MWMGACGERKGRRKRTEAQKRQRKRNKKKVTRKAMADWKMIHGCMRTFLDKNGVLA